MNFKYVLAVLIAVIALGACNEQAQHEKKEAEPEAKVPRRPNTPDLATVVPKVVSQNGFGYDPDYIASISKPSPYLSDFFSYQALQTNDAATIKADFVPENATLVSEDSLSVVLDFNDFGKVTFYTNASLQIQQLLVPMDHAVFEGETWQEFMGGIHAFMALVHEKGLTDKYLVENPFYDYEQKVYGRMNADLEETEVILDADMKKFTASDNAIYIFPDMVHGDSTRFEAFKDILKNAEYDWVGLEMLSDDQQKNINAFLSSPTDSEEYKAAENALKEVYSASWKIKTTQENPWIDLFTLVKQKGKKIYGMEHGDPTYLIFRYGETSFGGAVRNVIWVSNIPKEGKGIIFGGSSHFNNEKSIDFQDFAKLENPNLDLFSDKEID